jgi:hypothetical protein
MRGRTIKNTDLDNSQGKGLCGGDTQISVKTSVIKIPKSTKSEQQKEKNKMNKSHDRKL